MRRYFGKPNDGVGNFQGGLDEHLYLNNGQVHTLISDKAGSLDRASDDDWEARVERLFMQVLSQKPTRAKTAHFVARLSANDDAPLRLREAIWSLLTCSEFRFNH